MNARILIVEDDLALAELLSWNFETDGFVVTSTPDGEEALLLASEQIPDVIILDWMIEGISGIEVCRRLVDFVVSPDWSGHYGLSSSPGRNENRTLTFQCNLPAEALVMTRLPSMSSRQR